jgi:DNA replication protein DnaC
LKRGGSEQLTKDTALLNDLATCKFFHEKVCVLIAGPCGTGKSHIAQAIAHCAIRQNIDTLFFTQTQLFRKLLAARGVGAYESRFKTLSRIPLLIIDDFGLKPLKSGQDEDLHDLVSERYEKFSTIITSNLHFDEWGDAFPNKLLGAATLDRLRHAAYKLVLDGKSYRSIGRLDKLSNSGNLGN